MLKKFLICLIAPLALVAFTAAPALATEVTPGATEFKAKLAASTEATFTPDNGLSTTSIKCSVSTTSGKTPSNTEPASRPFNNNVSSEENTKKLAGGSVVANLVLPKFETCTSVAGVTTKVTTSETNGKWSIDWNVLNSAAAEWTTAAVGVPKAGATITLEESGLKCALTVDPETAQGVIGYWKNGKNEVVEVKGKEASTLYVNEQMFYAATAATKTECETDFGIANAASPAVFHATYIIEDAAGEGVVEKYT